MPHTIIGLFHENDFRSVYLFKDIQNVLGADTRFVILWDQFDTERRYADVDTSHLVTVEKQALLDYAVAELAVERDRLVALCDAYKPFLKILLCVYVRRVLGVDYAIMTDNDIYLFEDIPEIRELAAAKTPFFIPEGLISDRLPSMVRTVAGFGRAIFYRAPKKGQGYNVGFCGLDLTMLDVMNAQTGAGIVEDFLAEPNWCKEQAFLVLLAFSDPPERAGESMARLHTFDDQRYFFTSYDARDYQSLSRIYHCLVSSNKAPVNMLFAHRYVWVPGMRYEALIPHLRTRLTMRLLQIGRTDDLLAQRLVLNSFNPFVYYYAFDAFDGQEGEVTGRDGADPRAGMAWQRLRNVTRRFYLYGAPYESVPDRLMPTGVRFETIVVRQDVRAEDMVSGFAGLVGLLLDDGILVFTEVPADGFDAAPWAALGVAWGLTMTVVDHDRDRDGRLLLLYQRS